MAAPFWWRRRRARSWSWSWPLVVCAAVAADAVPPGLLSQRTGATSALAVFAVASWSEHRRWATVVPSVLAVLFVVGGVDDGNGWRRRRRRPPAVIGLPWALGVAARSRRAELDEAVAAVADAERERDEQARRAVVEERAHIARELHDVVAHHVSLIGVQAAARPHRARPRPGVGPGRRSARSRRRAGEAVGEMRHLLDALRDGDARPGTTRSPGSPTSTGSLAGFRAAGLDVDRRAARRPAGLGAAPRPHLLPPARGGPHQRHPPLGRGPGRGALRRGRLVGAARGRGPGPGSPAATATDRGRGRLGMAERAALFGGGLHGGPTATGGWLVVGPDAS